MTLSLIAVPTSSRRRVIGPTSSRRAFRAEPLWISSLDRNFCGIIGLDQSDTIDFDRHLLCPEERANPIISLEDCIGRCGLDADEVAAIMSIFRTSLPPLSPIICSNRPAARSASG